MKKTGIFLGSSIALTVVFYLLAYYLLPPPPPSSAMMLLFAGISMVLVWIVQCLVHRTGPKKEDVHKTRSILLLMAFTGTLSMLMSCHGASSSNSERSSPSPSPAPAPAENIPPPPPPGPVPHHHETAAAHMPRVTGTALLASSQAEDTGYGLYSYVLLSHPPGKDELPKYQAFFKALIGLPEASQLGKYLPKTRINVTYIPVTSVPSGWEQLAADKRVDSVMANYDYARGAAMLASLAKPIGVGPVIISLLTPLNLESHPHPVLVQDLSKAQTALVDSYVQEFVQQAAQDRFWKTDTLQAFSLSLRNLLETAATGLGMSQTAVSSWVQYFK